MFGILIKQETVRIWWIAIENPICLAEQKNKLL